MNFIALGIFLLVHICSYSIADAAAYNEACTEDANCTDTSQMCNTTSGTCACHADNHYSYAGNKCVKELGSVCSDTSECNDGAIICDANVCKCDTATHYDSNGEALGGSCIAKRSLGGQCTDTSQCNYQFSACKSDGNTLKCDCQDGYYNDGSTCSKRYLGQTCTANSHCSTVSNSECKSGQCTCSSGFYQTGTSSTDTCTKRNLGEQCTDTNQCDYDHPECKTIGGTMKCDCQNDYYNDGNACSKRYLGQMCAANSHCSIISNSECNSGKCTCTSDYYQTGTTSSDTCKKRYLGQTCSANSHCSIVSNSECNSGKCTCSSGYYQTGTSATDTCKKSQLGYPCLAPNQCLDGNAVCSGNRCQCPSTHYDSNGSGLGGSCKLKVSLGEVCPQPTNSVPNSATCSDNNARCSWSGSSYTCLCISTYYDNMVNADRKCVKKVALGDNCPMDDACGTEHASCVGGKCACDSQYYDNNGLTLGGTCIIRVSLGATCTGKPPVNSKQCIDSNAACSLDSSSYTCTCNSGYHQEGSACVANKKLGESCNSASQEVECSDPAALCLDSKCTCKSSHYDNNRFLLGGNCDPMTNLQVINVGFSSIQTNQITLSWSAPENYKQFIDGYTVQWRPTNGNSIDGESESLDSSETTLTLTKGIDPGRAYTVTIISKNEHTQQGSVRRTSVIRDQAAKPGKTSGIDWSNSDQNTDGGSISVTWIDPSGYESVYNVNLLDGATQIRNRTVTSTFVSFQSSGLKNGFRYSVTIQAKSETYDNGKTVQGDIFKAVFKTTAKIPGQPQNGLCKDPTDGSITLTWAAPTVPNGDLVRYHIHVYKDSSTLKFIVSTTGAGTGKTVQNLEPGTSYVFRIYTENERGNSSNYEMVSGCKTRARMSEAPKNLEITGVTSRGFDISWDKPGNTYSAENYGYVLQIKEQASCVKEVIYNCSDCSGHFQISNLTGLCEPSFRIWIDKTEADLEKSLTYSASLNPDTVYTVFVTAINDEGRGHAANKSNTTNEEAPQAPDILAVSDIGTTSLKVSWNIGTPRPGKTNFTIMLRAESPAVTREFTVTGYDTRTYMAEGLEEYWNYSIIVTAATSVGTNSSRETQQYKTLPAAPGKVSEFDIEEAPDGNFTQMKITWKEPIVLERNSVIKSYKFEYYATGRVTTTQNFSQESFQNHVYKAVLPVKPEETYTLTVYAINTVGQNGENITTERMAPAGVPVNIEETLDVNVIPKTTLKDVEQTSFTVSLVEDYFTQSTYGVIRDNGIAVCAKDCNFLSIKTLDDFNNMANYKEANKVELYRATPKNWFEDLQNEKSQSRRKRAVADLEFTVGDDDCSQIAPGEYCNGPLQPDTSYNIVAVTCTNGGCLVSREYGPFVTKAVPEETNSTPMIIGIVVAVVVLLAVGGVVGYIMLRRRRSGPGKMKPAKDSDDDDFTTVDPALAKIPRKRPILLSNIEEYVNNMHRDSNLLFSSEYEDLKTLSPKHSCEAADKEENRMRNRYINIIPFDHTRVKLSTNGEDDSSDYINANYLPGYNSPREYIGCQGPIPGTIDDFWRMTWEQNVSVIVMLTLCKEGQKIKCEQYWPDEVGEPKQYGDVIVEITSYSNIRTYDYRMFKITNGSTTRVVKHFHFLSWLDFQANVHHDIILDFIQHVRQHVQPPDTSGPMIIHCSAGVGRTGTYIALDHLIQFINDHDFDVEIDVFDLVLKLRENRQHMVQTEQQYVFIHDCVKEIIDRKRQSENIYVNQAFSQDENIYQNEQSLYANVSVGKTEQNTEL